MECYDSKYTTNHHPRKTQERNIKYDLQSLITMCQRHLLTTSSPAESHHFYMTGVALTLVADGQKNKELCSLSTRTQVFIHPTWLKKHTFY